MISSQNTDSPSKMDIDCSQNLNEMTTEIIMTVASQNSINICEDGVGVSSITSATQAEFFPEVYFQRSQPLENVKLNDSVVEELKETATNLKINLRKARSCAVRLRRELRQEKAKNDTLQSDLKLIKRLYNKYF